MNKSLLPLGTVVQLKNGAAYLFVVGYGVHDSSDQTKIYEYIGYLYPEGFLSPSINYLFNNEDIEKVIFKGYSDNKYVMANNNLCKFINDFRKENEK